MQRRSFVQCSAAAFLVTLAASCTQSPPSEKSSEKSRSTPSSNSNVKDSVNGVKIIIGYATIASALPLFCAVKRGFFEAAGLTVELQKMVSPQPTIEGLLAGRIHGCSNGTASGSLAIAAISSPDLFRIIAANATNQTFVLDEIIRVVGE